MVRAGSLDAGLKTGSKISYEIERNALSIAISTIAIAGFGIWLSLPESTTIHSLYERYIAEEELKPRMFSEGIAVRLNREAPPVAALEEALRDQPWAAIEPNPSLGVPAIRLSAGVTPSPAMDLVSPTGMAEKIIASNRQFEASVLSRRNAVRLAPAVLPSVIAPPLPHPYQRLQQKQDSLANRGGASTGLSVAQHTGRKLEEIKIQAVVPSPQAADPLPQAAVPSPRVISLSKSGFTREQLLAALFMPIAQEGIMNRPRANARTDSASQPIFRRSMEPSSRRTSAAPAAVVKPDSGISLAAAQELAGRSSASFVGGATSGNSTSGALAPAGRQIMIRGPIELAGGLALTHARDRIAVVRESRGHFIESGAVWIREGRYEIFVESMEGHLVAEVRSPQGEVIGRGQLELASVLLQNSNRDRRNIDGLVLKVQPMSSGIAGRAQSAYSSSATGTSSGARAVSRGLQGARVEFNQTPSVVRSVSGGHFEESKFSEGSRVVARLKTKEHWPTLAMMTSGSEPVVPVFSAKMMNAFVGLTDKSMKPIEQISQTTGVIWGRVMRSSTPIAGAKVEVLTEGVAEPIYFNELMLPDPTLKSTGSNGIFALPGATAGLHGIQIQLGKRTSDPVYIPAEPGTVSHLELDVLRASEIHARAFEAFNPDVGVQVDLKPMGHNKTRRMVIDAEAGRAIKLAHLGAPSILDVEGGSDYLSVRLIQNPDTRHLDVPMVSRGWYDRVIGQVKYNTIPQTGNILGFIQGQRFRVTMEESALSAAAKVIYFDSRGEMTSREYGEPGGGFLLLGVKDGLQTVIVETEGSNRQFAATVLVQEGIVATVSHWLR